MISSGTRTTGTPQDHIPLRLCHRFISTLYRGSATFRPINQKTLRFHHTPIHNKNSTPVQLSTSRRVIKPLTRIFSSISSEPRAVKKYHHIGAAHKFIGTHMLHGTTLCLQPVTGHYGTMEITGTTKATTAHHRPLSSIIYRLISMHRGRIYNFRYITRRTRLIQGISFDVLSAPLL
jgi:hypothetical protein